MNETLIYLLFAAAVVLPILPGAAELRSRKDVRALDVDARYTSDPRYFAASFRRKIRGILAGNAPGSRVPFLNRAKERARVVETLRIADGAGLDDALISTGDVRSGSGVQLFDVYAAGCIEAGDRCKVRTITADGSASLGSGAVVERWADAQRNLTIGEGSALGRSASAGGTLTVGAGATFSRLFGKPVIIGMLYPAAAGVELACEEAWDAPRPRERTGGTRAIAANSTLTGDIVCGGDVEIGESATLRGAIKAAGSVRVGAGACVTGSIVARGDVHLDAGAAVSGHVFSERDVLTERGCSIGAPHAPKTVYASRDMYLREGTTIFGWAICERRGATLAIGD